MFKLYSKRCEHAVRILAAANRFVAESSRDSFQAPEISDQTGISLALARKTLHELAGEGLIQSIRGPGGGFAFHSNPDAIRLLDIVHAVDGPEAYDGCVLGFPECDDRNPCPMHDHWMRVKKDLLKHLGKVSLKQLSANQ